MDKKQERFLQELLADFQVEADEHYLAIVNCLIEIEKQPSEEVYAKVVEQAYREMHSLKGASRAVNLVEIERLSQSLESVFSNLKQRKVMLGQGLFDLLHQAMDVLSQMLAGIKSGNKTVRGDQVARTIEALQSVRPDETVVLEKQEKPEADPPVNAVVQTGSTETVRVSVEKLSGLLLRTEELIPVKSALAHNLKLTREVEKRFIRGRESSSNEERKASGEIITQLANNLEALRRSTIRIIDDLIAATQGILLFPFSSILDILPKMVRDLSRDQQKQVNFTIVGGDVVIDRRILEEVKDPLIHLIRNSVDHGIEHPDVRIKSGKPPEGSLMVTVIKHEQYVEVVISDDGAGMDRSRLLDVAVQQGVVSREKGELLSDQEVIGLSLLSGISTSRFITDLSGRGLGMAIVSEKVNLLGGQLSIESSAGKGTRFSIRLPLKLATFRGIMIRISDHFFLVPDNYIEKAIRVGKDSFLSVEDQPTIMVHGQPVPVQHLGTMLDIPGTQGDNRVSGFIHAVIVNSGEYRVALVVDEILEEEEGIIKQAGGFHQLSKIISGATLLGNGQIVPILNIPELLEFGVNRKFSIPADKTNGEPEGKEVVQQNILVAEDSITARSLLRNILESAGYKVKTAVDGLEALMFLKNGEFNLVVSDVEMPGLNGFELITKIREEKRFGDLPVILVTALDSASDRQRGMDCGANAYIVKSDFEQSNLLEVIRRLI